MCIHVNNIINYIKLSYHYLFYIWNFLSQNFYVYICIYVLFYLKRLSNICFTI